MSKEENSFAPNGYDTVWCLALALNHSMALLAKQNLSLSNFSYRSQQGRQIAKILRESVLNTRFNGMSVSLRCHSI